MAPSTHVWLLEQATPQGPEALPDWMRARLTDPLVLPLPFAWLRALVALLLIRLRLAPHADELMQRVHREMVAAIRRGGAVAALALTPVLKDDFDPARLSRLRTFAREQGVVEIDLLGAYEGHSRQGLFVAAWDHHPNRKGHELLAAQFLSELRRRAHALGEGP